MTAEFHHRNEWAYREQVDDEKNELLFRPIRTTPPTTRNSRSTLSVIMAITVVAAMIAFVVLALLAGMATQ